MEFVDRHIGPRDADVSAMARAVGYEDLDALISAVVPDAIASPSATAGNRGAQGRRHG